MRRIPKVMTLSSALYNKHLEKFEPSFEKVEEPNSIQNYWMKTIGAFNLQAANMHETSLIFVYHEWR